MAQRYIRIALAMTLGLLAGLWAINNLINWETARGAVAYALSQDNQSGYSNHIVPPIRSDGVATFGLLMIVAAEVTASLLAFIGGLRMWFQRHAAADAFSRAKQFAIAGAGIAVLNWFLGFLVIGGALLMMGQAEGMEGAVRGATTMATLSFLTLIFLSQPEPDAVGA